jgi:uncharacterized protein
MLRFDVRSLRQGSVVTDAALAPDDPAFQGLDATLRGPVRVRGELQAAGPETFRWQGRIAGEVSGECRRCLKDVVAPFAAEVSAVFTAAPDVADDPGVYPLAEPVTAVDLTEAVREEVGLAVPAYLQCREDCAGLCPRCGADLNEGPCGCARSPEPT